MKLAAFLLALPALAWFVGVNTIGEIILALAGGFILLARWASQSIPRAIVFVALLCASPVVIAIVMGFTIAALEATHPAKVQRASG